MRLMANFLKSVVIESTGVTFTLFKVMIPLIILVKILQEFGAISIVSALLEPVMGWVGLPGSMGLVWATAMLTNLYGGIAVFASLSAENGLTIAQMTVLTTMMLVAHALPVEVAIARQAGVRYLVMLIIRLGSALALGALLNWIYLSGDWLQGAATLAWRPTALEPGLMAWAINELAGLGIIFLIILLLILVLRTLDKIGAAIYLTRLFQPLLRLLGIGDEAINITVVGMTLGISYGGGLLIKEAKAGHVSPKDVLFAMTLLGLSHSLIEDTLLMLLVGGHISGVFWARIFFTFAAVFLFVRLIAILPDSRLSWFVIPKKD